MDVRHPRLALKIFAFMVASLTVAAVHAEGDDINGVSLEDLLNIKVTTASKIEQKQSEAPGIVTVLKRQDFKDYGWYSLNDALYHQAGFFPSRDYDRRTVGSRGLFEGWNNNHLLLLVDGVPFNDPMYGTAYTSEITPVFMMKSIEILRGPGSALYGSNATNGVIAVNTFSGSDLNGSAEVSLRAGSYNTNEWSVMTGNARGKWNYLVGAEGLQTAGLNYESYDASGLSVKPRLKDDRSNRYLFFKAEGQENLKGLSFEYHDQQWHYQTGHGWLFAIPDQPDIMSEYRQVATLSYRPHSDGKMSSEFTFKYERKENDWNTRYLPNGGIAFATPYPDGITERLDFVFDHYFARAQGAWDFGSGASLLAGLEASAFVYGGDRVHNSNTDLAGGTYAPTAPNTTVAAPDALGLITDKPIVNIGAYTQFTTGDWIRFFNGTVGLRYDNETVHFDEAKASPANVGNGKRTFNQLSPRLAFVMPVGSDLSFKILLGRAFRAPSPSELAGVNTWALANNIRNLKPEIITTGEAGAEYRISKVLSSKANFFVTEMKDQIGYSGTTNLSTNIYTTKTMGVEGELNYKNGPRSGFFNVSYASRLDESIADPSVSASKTKVTWAPSLTANLGMQHEINSVLKIAAVAQYMSEVKRRTSDTATPANIALRGNSIPAWFGLDTGAGLRLTKDDQVDFSIRNLFDTHSHLIKNRDYGFDYQTEGVNYYTSYSHTF